MFNNNILTMLNQLSSFNVIAKSPPCLVVQHLVNRSRSNRSRCKQSVGSHHSYTLK